MRKEQKQTFILSSRLEGSEKFKTYLCNTMPEDVMKLCRLDFEADFTGGYRITYQFYSDNEVMKEIIIRFFAEHTSVYVYVTESVCYRLKETYYSNNLLEEYRYNPDALNGIVN